MVTQCHRLIRRKSHWKSWSSNSHPNVIAILKDLLISEIADLRFKQNVPQSWGSWNLLLMNVAVEALLPFRNVGSCPFLNHQVRMRWKEKPTDGQSHRVSAAISGSVLTIAELIDDMWLPRILAHRGSVATRNADESLCSSNVEMHIFSVFLGKDLTIMLQSASSESPKWLEDFDDPKVSTPRSVWCHLLRVTLVGPCATRVFHVDHQLTGFDIAPRIWEPKNIVISIPNGGADLFRSVSQPCFLKSWSWVPLVPFLRVELGTTNSAV